jgi:ADP-ribose pyrophosphatase YjhB (NUDIX family)
MPSGWMIDENDPACQILVARAEGLHVASSPNKAAHSLGAVTLANGKVVKAWLVHSVDPVITDGEYVVMIDRLNPPGQGLPALPGGLIDPKEGGGVETAVEAAVREAGEEVKIDVSKAKATVVGARNVNRADDVRVAQGNHLEKYGIKEGDIFMVSAQAVRFDVPGLSKITLHAGDDAKKGSARLVKISSLTRESCGIPLHFDEIMQAVPKGRAAAPAKPKPARKPSR